MDYGAEYRYAHDEPGAMQRVRTFTRRTCGCELLPAR